MRPSRFLLGVVAIVAVAAALAGCGSSSHSSTPTSTSSSPSGPSGGAVTGTVITIKNFAFSPATLTVTPGTRVTVHNDDSVTHTLTAVPHNSLFNTGDIAPGGTVTFIAPAAPGTYPYICLIHQFMHGTLVVS